MYIGKQRKTGIPLAEVKVVVISINQRTCFDEPPGRRQVLDKERPEEIVELSVCLLAVRGLSPRKANGRPLPPPPNITSSSRLMSNHALGFGGIALDLEAALTSAEESLHFYFCFWYGTSNIGRVWSLRIQIWIYLIYLRIP